MTTKNTTFMYTITMTAKVEIEKMGGEANDVLNRYERLASALCKFKGLDVETEMAEYDREIAEFIESDEIGKPIVPKETIGEFIHDVLNMCETLYNPKEILGYINTAYEILEINEPKYAVI